MLSTEAASYDYVIVGGGSAGCVVASRLAAASPDAAVALIEAGPDGRGVAQIVDPPSWTKLSGTALDWGYAYQPAEAGGRPADRDPARQGPRRLQRDQRDAVVPGSPGRLRRLGGGRRGRLELPGDAALPAAQRGLGGRRVRPAGRGRPDAGHPAAGAAPDRRRHDRRRGRARAAPARRRQRGGELRRRPRQPQHRRRPAVQRGRRVPAGLGAAARAGPGSGRRLDAAAGPARQPRPC